MTAEPRLVLRPLDIWTDRQSAPRVTPFGADWSDSRLLLLREVRMLGGSEVVVQLDADARWFRQDERLRSDYRTRSAGVVVSFDSEHGPLRYACNAFVLPRDGRESWQCNVRAIALGLESLRRVTRYEIGESRAQYQGWAQLGAGTPMLAGASETMTRTEAAQFLADWGAEMPVRTNEGLGVILDDQRVARRLYNAAVKRLHPDTTSGESTPELYRRLELARHTLQF